MKKIYNTPEIQICKFQTEDVLSTSGYKNLNASYDNEGVWKTEWDD